jgi:hypothetical protein
MATATDVGARTEGLDGLHYAGIALAAVTGVIHLWLGVSFLSSPLGVSFLLAGLGFFGAIALVVFDVRRRLVYAIGIPFTGVQILIWAAFNWPLSPFGANLIGTVDKVVQLALIGVLVVLIRQDGR